MGLKIFIIEIGKKISDLSIIESLNFKSDYALNIEKIDSIDNSFVNFWYISRDIKSSIKVVIFNI